MRASKKDFIDIADRCRYLKLACPLDPNQYAELVETIAYFLQQRCPNFVLEKFTAYCYAEKVKP